MTESALHFADGCIGEHDPDGNPICSGRLNPDWELPPVTFEEIEAKLAPWRAEMEADLAASARRRQAFIAEFSAPPRARSTRLRRLLPWRRT